MSASPRLAILTLPLRGNYGGMLQAYALQESLKRLGYAPCIVDTEEPAFSGPQAMQEVARQCRYGKLMRFFGLRMKGKHFRANQVLMARAFTSRFTERVVLSDLAPEERARFFAGMAACVVGSDQVWRSNYARGCGGLGYFFLNAIPTEVRARSISYAASFGTDTWGGNEEETAECRTLLGDFRAVSVREHSGTDLCREPLGRADAVQMPDPTLLAELGDYERIMEAGDEKAEPLPESPFVVDYILDSTRDKRRLIAAAAEAMQLQDTLALAHDRRGRRDGHLHPYSVGLWLRAIRKGRLMVTDSFHGCVFSIIFNTPFICIPNGKRGTSRFESLLRTFGLENRVLSPEASPADIAQLAATPIDWEKVHACHAAERERALRFLRENLPSHGAC